MDGDTPLLALTRYVVLNPVRASMVLTPGDWPWSSYLAMTGQRNHPDWLAVDGLLAQFSTQRPAAIRRYEAFVAKGTGHESIWVDLKGQIFLGDEAFMSRMQSKDKRLSNRPGVPKAQARAPAATLKVLALNSSSRNEAIVEAYATGSYSYQQIADYYALHFTTVGKIVRNART